MCIRITLRRSFFIRIFVATAVAKRMSLSIAADVSRTFVKQMNVVVISNASAAN
jgi:hypothetical protein